MNIYDIVDKIASVHGVTVRIRDYRSNEIVGSQGFLAGSGIESKDYSFEFNDVQEFDTFIDILLSARSRLTIQDNRNQERGHVIVHHGDEDEYYEECSVCHSKDVSVDDNYCSNCGTMFLGQK